MKKPMVSSTMPATTTGSAWLSVARTPARAQPIPASTTGPRPKRSEAAPATDEDTIPNTYALKIRPIWLWLRPNSGPPRRNPA